MHKYTKSTIRQGTFR